jgi:AraC-like DNA-binding protein
MVVTSPQSPTRLLDYDEFRQAVDASFVPLKVHADRPDRFRGSLAQARSGGVTFSVVEATPHAVERTPALIERTPEQHIKLGLQVSGSGLLIQDGREALLSPGELTIYDTSRPYTLEFDSDYRCFVVMFPTSMSEITVADLAQFTATPLSQTGGLGSVVTPYLLSIAADLGSFDMQVGNRLAHSSLDLVNTMLLRELELFSGGTSGKRRQFSEVTEYIECRLSMTELTPASIARGNFMSVRALHALFHSRGTTVSTWIRNRRLSHCHAELADPAHSGESISQIAARWGYADAPNFSRAFRREFGMPPSAARREWSGPPDEAGRP